MVDFQKGFAYMWDIERYEKIFAKYGGMMRAKQLDQERVFYKKVQSLIQEGYVEKIRTGYYQWINPQDFNEVGIVIRKRTSPDCWI